MTQAAARSRTGRLLRELDAHLVEAEAALCELGPPAVTARTALAQARSALAEVRAERLAEQGRGAHAPDPGRLALARRVELPADPRAAGQARSFCLATCDEWDLPTATCSAAKDVCSELVANAAACSTSPVVLALELGPEALLVRVWDDGPGAPRVLPYRPGISERGLGLRLVKQLSSHWGVADDAGGKWVWARVALPEPDLRR